MQEMIKVRQRLVEDYRINPDLMARCSNEIEVHCNGLEPGGNTLHCLMKLARDRKQQKRIRDECRSQVSVSILRPHVESYEGDHVVKDVQCFSVEHKDDSRGQSFWMMPSVELEGRGRRVTQADKKNSGIDFSLFFESLCMCVSSLANLLPPDAS